MSRKTMPRRTVLKRIGAASAGMVLASASAAGSGTGAPVSKKLAREIASDAVSHVGTRPGYEEWHEDGVRAPESFYAKIQNGDAVDYKPRAWVFPIENGGTDVGYMAISAVQTQKPVLVYGPSTAPQRNIQMTKQVATAKGHSLNGRYIYHGGIEFGVETSGPMIASLRRPVVKKQPAVSSLNRLTPIEDDHSAAGPKDKQDSEVDWSGGTDEEVSGDVPDWTETDGGNASTTDFGKGDDSWGGWDGCIPIAASMVLGYHEGLDENDADEREALIDRLHETMNTGDGDLRPGYTNWDDIPSGIESYSHGDNSYNAHNRGWGMKGRVKTQIKNGQPAILNMENGPYTSKGGGHSVCVVGYREESCGLFCSDFYHKVYDGYSDDTADKVLHNAWANACVTKVTVDN